MKLILDLKDDSIKSAIGYGKVKLESFAVDGGTTMLKPVTIATPDRPSPLTHIVPFDVNSIFPYSHPEETMEIVSEIAGLAGTLDLRAVQREAVVAVLQ